MKKILVFLISCVVGISSIGAKSITVCSPDKNVKVQVSLVNGEMGFEVYKGKNRLICNSSLGLIVDGSDFKRFEIVEKKTSHFSELWNPVWGKQSEILNCYEELTLLLKEPLKKGRKLNIVFRVYDDGVAFRYEIPEQKGINIFNLNADLTTFELPAEDILWAPNGEDHNIGPVNVADVTDVVSNNKSLQTPLVVDSHDNGFIAVHEAATFNFSYALLKPSGNNTFQFDMEPSTGTTPAKTSWRVFMLGDEAGDLLESDLLVNLCPPCEIEDPSWIKPGVTFEDWRGLGAKAGGFTYSANQESYRRYIDFAAEKGIEYVILSAWWYHTNGIRFTKDGMDLKSIVEYADNKGVGVILYIDRIRKEGTDWELEDVLKEWHTWGVKGIKYGFLGGECKYGRQELVKKTREIVELCAKYEMLVDFHDGPVPPSGDSRTWPNLITREYCHAQADSKRAFQPKTFVASALVNGIAGALDMSNGYFELNTAEQRAKVWEPIPSTVVAEAARAFIIYSGLVVIPDIPEAYKAKDDLFNFITNIEGLWDETRVLKTKIGEYIVIARRKGNTWMVGAATNEDARELEINLDFLVSGKYEATIFTDGENASAFGDKERYSASYKTVVKDEVYSFKMAPGGGHCMILKKKTE